LSSVTVSSSPMKSASPKDSMLVVGVDEAVRRLTRDAGPTGGTAVHEQLVDDRLEILTDQGRHPVAVDRLRDLRLDRGLQAGGAVDPAEAVLDGGATGVEPLVERHTGVSAGGLLAEGKLPCSSRVDFVLRVSRTSLMRSADFTRRCIRSTNGLPTASPTPSPALARIFWASVVDTELGAEFSEARAAARVSCVWLTDLMRSAISGDRAPFPTV
jgi:AcrR family transcriptional regulator